MQTNDRQIVGLMIAIDTGKAQLPDFQRGWVWDDNRIRALIASITNNYPVGAAMFLEYGNECIRFKYRMIEGAPETTAAPTELILDGQQRLTSIYSSLYCKKPVHTRTDKGAEITRYYYIDIKKAIDPNVDRIEAIKSVPENKVITADFGRNIILDLSTVQKEYDNMMFPLNIILDSTASVMWMQGLWTSCNGDSKTMEQWFEFQNKIINTVDHYVMPVISLGKETPKEAVCQVFENVNTGGVSLTVFELITAIFAMDNFELRKDWEQRQKKYFSGELLNIVTATDFLTACTLLTSFKNGGTVSCKKRDVLNLSLASYVKYADALSNGFVEAERLLEEERIFSSKDLPYTTQIIPLAVLCTLLTENNQIKATSVKNKIKQWYWCGVFGEMYGGANETRYALDVTGVMDWVKNDSTIPRTVQESYFNPMRLLSLRTRQSAAYKGIMALVLKNHCRDFISGREMDFTVFKSENIDIHHIFPASYCEKRGYEKDVWNSIVNKTPISYSTNREIGGVSPNTYLAKIEKNGKATHDELNEYIRSHMIDVDSCRTDDFYGHIAKRAKMLLHAIEIATGKPISGKDSEEVIKAFGQALV